jgi:hypothetical protein
MVSQQTTSPTAGIKRENSVLKSTHFYPIEIILIYIENSKKEKNANKKKE